MKAKIQTKKRTKLKSPKQVPVRDRVEGPAVSISFARVMALVHNNMSPVADKAAALEMLAEQLGSLTQVQIDNFVLHQLPKLPGYHVRDALAILDNLTKFRERYFS